MFDPTVGSKYERPDLPGSGDRVLRSSLKATSPAGTTGRYCGCWVVYADHLGHRPLAKDEGQDSNLRSCAEPRGACD